MSGTLHMARFGRVLLASLVTTGHVRGRQTLLLASRHALRSGGVQTRPRAALVLPATASQKIQAETTTKSEPKQEPETARARRQQRKTATAAAAVLEKEQKLVQTLQDTVPLEESALPGHVRVFLLVLAAALGHPRLT